MEPESIPLRATSQAITEFEFHISPICSSSRPHTGVGTCGTRSSRRRAIAGWSLSRVRAVDRLVDVEDASVTPLSDAVAK